MNIYFLLNSEKDVRFKYRKYDLEDNIVGVSKTWYSSGQSFIKLLKLIERELDMAAMNNWKKKFVGLQS